MSYDINQQPLANSGQLPLNKGQFYAAASLVTQTTAQYIPVSALATTTANTGGGMVVSLGGNGQSRISGFRVRYTGDVANVGGQLVAFQLWKNGVAITTGVTTPAATTAGTFSTSVDLSAAPIAVADGDLIQCSLSI